MSSSNASLQYLRFVVDGSEYGIDILDVREIRRNDRPTQVAGAADGIAGIIELRGEIVPIVDLRTALGRAPGTSDVCIIVNVDGRSVGLAADRVCEVVRIGRSEVRALPLAQETSFVSSVAVDRDERLTLLLDLGAFTRRGPTSSVPLPELYR
ncbi:MAG TPA: chemotaxis protein CheW [Candidatus Acidoferrum sp.]|jgi:purine-binding chemotaxis protein CheW|nr:chemotaxis protein CheW [Candidatus Acidoferrum sp.]